MFVIFAYGVSKKLDTSSSIINNYFVRQNLIFYSALQCKCTEASAPLWCFHFAIIASLLLLAVGYFAIR